MRILDGSGPSDKIAVCGFNDPIAQGVAGSQAGTGNVKSVEPFNL